MSTPRPTIPVRVASGKPSAEALAQMDRHWRWRHVMLAPHRLGFLLAMVVLVASGVWWALVQVDRSTQWGALPAALPPTLVHSAVMAFGFIPLFFSGFLFTAGPKWLGVEPLAVSALRFPLLAQAAGWLLWLAGAHWHAVVALAGLALACGGLVGMTVQFWGRVRLSQAQDQLHARVIAGACLLGCVSVAGLWLSLVLGAPSVARAWVFCAARVASRAARYTSWACCSAAVASFSCPEATSQSTFAEAGSGPSYSKIALLRSSVAFSAFSLAKSA